MDLSVIIVSYRARAFLNLCLHAVGRAMKEAPATEVIIVDNASGDGTAEWIADRFPAVKLIRNARNLGFGAACNQGLAIASGRYILFLNPDTLIPENALRTCIDFLQSRPQTAALGVRMIDGSGQFLPESKRGFPSVTAAASKMLGLSAVFPRSAIFARYHMGHLEEKKISEVEVLSGAFMMAARETLRSVNGFDEEFFMYGEDIDLSYRLRKNGSNIYFPEITIIHFKGESSQSDDPTYIRNFYDAMMIFVKKHYRGAGGSILRLMLGAGIRLRESAQHLKARSRRAKPSPVLGSEVTLIGKGESAVLIRTTLEKRGSAVACIDSTAGTKNDEDLVVDVESVPTIEIIELLENRKERCWFWLSPYLLTSPDKAGNGTIIEMELE